MAREFDVVIERDAEGNYVASVPAIAGCHTQARSLDALMVRVREAIEANLEAIGDDGASLEFVGVQRISVSA
ncbi:MAG: type II toxin-antitoxin system HicB family antitoxin [Rhodospirillales bacterium]|jgi:predicted RNase H-like HicB family nuclease|nr:type II toxin-antitoxin system HicB family antitoxin [Rhodospirillales bacterium]